MKAGTIAAVWFLLALAVGKTRVLAVVPAPVVQAILLGLTAFLLILYWRSAKVLDWAGRVDIRALIAFHALRLVGFYFIYLYSKGRLPFAFAVPGGWGDIAVALLALGRCVPGAAPDLRMESDRPDGYSLRSRNGGALGSAESQCPCDPSLNYL